MKRDGLSTGMEPALLYSLQDFTTSQFPGTTLEYLATVQCLDDTGSWLNRKTLTQTLCFQYPCTSYAAAGQFTDSKFLRKNKWKIRWD